MYFVYINLIMENLKKLEKSKLLKELDYIKSEFYWRKEVMSSNDPLFINSVNEFLNKNPEIKKQFDEKINAKIDDLLEKERQKIIEDESEEDNFLNNEEESILQEELKEEKVVDQENVDRLKKIKSIYRQIVKLTHPDKVKNKKLNNLYLEATEYYQQEDLISIYSICDELDIDYTIEESEYDLISKNISKLKEQVNLFESTFTWNWYNTEDKDRVVIDYIKRQLV